MFLRFINLSRLFSLKDYFIQVHIFLVYNFSLFYRSNVTYLMGKDYLKLLMRLLDRKSDKQVVFAD
jgi:hypothetical protein